MDGAKLMSRRRLLTVATSALGATALAPVLSAHGAARITRQPSGKIALDLMDYDAVGLAELIRSGKISQRKVLEATIARIKALDGSLNAMTTLSFTRALKRVEEISPDTVFAGVPTVLKDLVDMGGVRRTSGSVMSLAYVPKQSVDYVLAMESAGLNIVGITNTPEFAALALTDNQAFGPTRNPWDLGRSAGGSSGGSAVAVAAGYVPLAHGTDGGGSNRIPASCCGVLGMKASRYRQVSGEADGGHEFLRTHQCLSRTVRDSAALLAATENPNNQAGYPPVGHVTGPGTKRLRIAVSAENCFGEQPEATVREALNKTVKLCKSLGHEVVEIKNPLDGKALFQALEAIMLVDMPGLLAKVEALTGKKAEEAGLLTKATVDLGRYGASLSPDAFKKGVVYSRLLTKEFEQFFTGYDMWLTPTIPIEAPKIGYLSHDTPFDLARDRNLRLLSYTALANCTGAPAMSVPLFQSSTTGLPIGSHFMAAPGADKILYELAYELEAAQPWADRWPTHSAKSRGRSQT